MFLIYELQSESFLKQEWIFKNLEKSTERPYKPFRVLHAMDLSSFFLIMAQM